MKTSARTFDGSTCPRWSFTVMRTGFCLLRHEDCGNVLSNGRQVPGGPKVRVYDAATPWDTLSECRRGVGPRHARSPERRPSLARLRQAHGIKVLLAVNPALQAVDADLYPYVSV